MKGYIYKWTNELNGKSYIGLTINKNRRYKDFIRLNRLYTTTNNERLTKIDKARIKYRVSSFKYEILKLIEYNSKMEVINELNKLEIKYILLYDTFKNGYNSSPGGEQPVISSEIELYDYKYVNTYRFKELKPREILMFIFLCLNKYNNISYKSISDFLNISINTVRSILKVLADKKFIIINYNKVNTYTILEFEIKKFEPFSKEFLKNKNISFKERAYIAASQQYMFKDIENYGKMTYSRKELSNILNVSEDTIYRWDKSLIKNGFLIEMNLKLKDLEIGCPEKEKLFKLKELGQAIIWKLGEHEQNIEELKQVAKSKDKLIEQLTKRIEQLEKNLINL